MCASPSNVHPGRMAFYRDHWWQNTRLPYGSMVAAGDLDSFRPILDFVLSVLPVALARTSQLLPGESGMFLAALCSMRVSKFSSGFSHYRAGAFWTETINCVNGLYLGEEYACDPSQVGLFISCSTNNATLPERDVLI